MEIPYANNIHSKNKITQSLGNQNKIVQYQI